MRNTNEPTTEQMLIRRQMDQYRPTVARMVEASRQIARAARRPLVSKPHSRKIEHEFGDLEQDR